MMPSDTEPLPPSHSEISKDHPPHPAPKDAPGHQMDAGSPFFELHKVLAVQAVKHLDILMARVWKTKSLVGSKWSPQLSEAALKAANLEATKAAKREKRRHRRGGTGIKRSFQQTELDLKNRPNMRSLLDAVDLYISHPDESDWWRPIVRNYVNKNTNKVLKEIALRNMSRKARK
ncbi:hypothetical protein H8E88_35035 [candidate division KSB1 bacterium]|nr:hypothetical protein [candidate division KSB1 bacterium]